jgi:1-aminocyclopropane-1-carboxylate deaminase/D-cysteine desulfhydrase-like pyridoxal-dependent ACC family enzyme
MWTTLQTIGGITLARDDMFTLAGVSGGKVRGCWAIATATKHTAGLLTEDWPPAVGLITASARQSPQAQIVAAIAAVLGVPCRCHMPTGAHTPEMDTVVADGGAVVQHRPGYNNVLIARALADVATRPGWRYIPFGMAHPLAVNATRSAVPPIPDHVRRVVIPMGSGVSAAGVLHGLRDQGWGGPVLGVRVGADPTPHLDKHAPRDWRSTVTIVPASVPYTKHVTASIGAVELDPHYEAKCAEFLRPGDLFWIVGKRKRYETKP